MKIYYETSLKDFDKFSRQAKMVRDLFTDEELKRLESILDSVYEISEGALEDMFAYDEKYICNLLGIDYHNDFLKRESRDAQ